MQSVIYKEDQGVNFGKWLDKTSQFMYVDSTKKILDIVGSLPATVADYGGGNGNLKKLIKHAISIDIDPSKKPDVVDNIITHKGSYDLVVLRYVMHYLNDYEVIQLFSNITSKNILVIQFTNDDLKGKYANSVNEHKYFRTSKQMQALLPLHTELYSVPYMVEKDFYINRLGDGNYTNHWESIKAYWI